MPPLSHTEIARLNLLSLLTGYQKHRQWYIDNARVLVRAARTVIGHAISNKNYNVITHGVYNISPDEIATILKDWLAGNADWKKILNHKAHIALRDYDIITENMARYVTYDAYSEIIT